MKTLNDIEQIRVFLKLLTLCIPFALPMSASSGPITWGTATTIVNDSDVSTNGTFLYAYHWAPGNQTLNGVTFTGTNSVTAGGSDVGLSGFAANTATSFTSTAEPFASLSSTYKATLVGSNYNSGATVTVTLKNLTVGNQYEAQVWCADPRAFGTGRFATLSSVSGNSLALDYNSTDAVGGLGQYSIGTFIADAATQTFTIVASTSAQLNALQVRDLGASIATLSPTFSPSPGSYYGAQTVTLESATSGATIYYTTNGDTPNNTSSSGPSGLTVNVPDDTTITIKAYAHKDGSPDSAIVSATYTTLPIVSGTWINLAGGSWTTATNWLGDVMADGVGSTADFSTLTLPADTTVTLDGAKPLGNLIFDDQNTTKSTWTLTTGSGGPLTLAVASGTPTVTSNAPTTISTVLAGTQGLQKEGPDVLTLTASNTYTGTTTVNNGTLVYQNTYASDSHVTASGTTLEFHVASGSLNGVTTTFSGAGSFVKSGDGELLWGAFGPPRIVTFAMSAGSLIDVQAGRLTIGSFADDDMTDSKADLHVAAGATFSSAACDAFVDALTGAGTIILAHTNVFPRTMTLGVDNSSGNFSGSLTDGTNGGQGRLVKTGSGTQTLSGTNTYTGETTVNEGTIALVGGSQTSPITVAANGSLGFTLGSPTTSTSTVNFLTGSTVAVTGAVGNSSDYLLMTATGGITGSPSLTSAIPGYSMQTRNAGTELWLNYELSGSPYETWANINAPTGDPDDDYDGDGVSNAVEFLLGGLATTNDLNKLPVAATSGNDMTFTFERDKTSVDASTVVTIEVSNDLVTWDAGSSPYVVPNTATGSANPGVTVVDNGATHTVTLTIPQAPDAKKFARLKVVITP